jgi:uncharacterized LabA/DUF88 family protein
MLSLDIAYVAGKNCDDIVLVSSDDDFSFRPTSASCEDF